MYFSDCVHQENVKVRGRGQGYQGTVHSMARSSLLTAFLPDVTDSELCPALWSWFVALVGVRSGQYPRANLSLSSLPSVSPWVSLVYITPCAACVHKAVFRAAQQRASSHPISSHLISSHLTSSHLTVLVLLPQHGHLITPRPVGAEGK